MSDETKRLIGEAWRFVQHTVRNGDFRTPQELVGDLLTMIRGIESEREQAEAERDAQHAEVLRLTRERDEAVERHRVRCAMMEQLHKVCNHCERQLSELTATRDLLTKENARLQARVATLELLLRGGK